MPCMCWISEESVSKEMNEMRSHIKEAARLAKEINRRGDLPPRGSDLGSLDINKLCHTLFDDYYAGVCSETGKKLD